MKKILFFIGVLVLGVWLPFVAYGDEAGPAIVSQIPAPPPPATRPATTNVMPNTSNAPQPRATSIPVDPGLLEGIKWTGRMAITHPVASTRKFVIWADFTVKDSVIEAVITAPIGAGTEHEHCASTRVLPSGVTEFKCSDTSFVYELDLNNLPKEQKIVGGYYDTGRRGAKGTVEFWPYKP